MILSWAAFIAIAGRGLDTPGQHRGVPATLAPGLGRPHSLFLKGPHNRLSTCLHGPDEPPQLALTRAREAHHHYEKTDASSELQ